MVLEEELKRLKEMHSRISDAEEDLKSMRAQYGDLEWRIVSFMQAGNIEGMKLDGMNYYLVSSTQPKVVDPEAFKNYVRENDLWDVAFMVSAAKLKAYCREQLAASAEIPAGVDTSFVQTKLHIRKA